MVGEWGGVEGCHTQLPPLREQGMSANAVQLHPGIQRAGRRTSTNGVSRPWPKGEPLDHAMLPLTMEGAYTPQGAMYGPGVVTTVSHTWR
jgi:hypothetical protein